MLSFIIGLTVSVLAFAGLRLQEQAFQTRAAT